MKRLISGVIVLMLLLCGAALAEEDRYLRDGLELAQKVGELARDDVYVSSVTTMKLECIELLKKADFTILKSAWRCDIPGEKVIRAIVGSGAVLSETGMEQMWRMLPSAVPSMYNARQGVEAVAASSILTYSRTYQMAEDFAPCIYVLELEGAAVCVAFDATGEDTITAFALPIFFENGLSVEQVIDGFSMEEMPLTFEKVA